MLRNNYIAGRKNELKTANVYNKLDTILKHFINVNFFHLTKILLPENVND